MRQSSHATARLGLVLGTVLLGQALAACSLFQGSEQPVWRTATIVDGHFNPDSISLAAGTPATLKVGLVGFMEASIRSPALGIEPTLLPTNQPRENKSHNAGPGNFKMASFPLRPMAAGTYQIICDCGGHEEILTLTVQPGG
ncbi:hypothetical protein GCM10011611_07620 [Aliidongia dinghuensis]|uniref:EfeO-type cupredoxin-like domain-containing protein n=2 Tax=Aliidongia dinghuensis TaxID=1867774 RepID=A0A8J2YQE4_9PROT|nr:hypothetical protein GCM10011611_07620 [Aliidongia dinghuensis]